MAREVAVFNPASNLPSFVRKGELSETAKALLGTPSGKRVSIKGGVFRLLDGGKEIAQIEERYLDVVILRAAPKVGRVWFAKKYDPDHNAAPDCWSADGERPSEKSAKPQSKTCADCKQNVAGSGEGNSRACRYQQRIAIALASQLDDDNVDAVQLTVPAASLFGKAEGDNRPLQDYARWLGAQGISPETLITRLKFDTNAESPKLWFKPMRWLEEEEYELVTRLAETPEATQAVTMDFASAAAPSSEGMSEGAPPAKKKAAAPAPEGEEEDPPAPPPKKKAAAPAPAPDPEGEEEDPPAPPPKKKAAAPTPEDDDPPAPTRRGGKAPAPAVASAKSLVDEWDD